MKRKPRPLNQTARAGVPLAVQAMEGTFTPKRIATEALREQLAYRAAGNPPGTLPTTAISNCFPGLEVDFRNVWKRMFAGIELHESDNLVVGTDTEHEALRFRRLVRIHLGDGSSQAIIVSVHGPDASGPDSHLSDQALEWGNVLAYVMRKSGQTLTCDFTKRRADDQVPFDSTETEAFPLTVRPFFEANSVVVARDLLGPGELTQSLCSPWQNDYRECACYYWAASRPDYVNVEAGPAGTSLGENWMQVRGSGPKQYQVDDFDSAGLLTYEDLFKRWETVLRFELAGQDSD